MEDNKLLPPAIMIGRSGMWMLGYEVMFDKMEGNLMGRNDITNAKVLEEFMVTPSSMTMQMHMAMVMYAPTKRLTLMLMAPYIIKAMKHVTRDNMMFTEHTNGIGDIQVRGLYSMYSSINFKHNLLLNAGIEFPTGSINQTMGEMKLEYPMQLGAGTFSILPGVMYIGKSKPWGWGAEFTSTLRVGKNNFLYKLGDHYKPAIWGIRNLTSSVTVSLRMEGDI